MSTALVPTGNIFTPEGFTTTQKIAETLVKSGILPRGIDTPAKAFAVIVKGWEIGVGPMRALTGIHLIEGKPSVSPELKLERFRERGGKIKWLRSDGLVAECTLTAPNGDTHTECVTLEEMKTAGVAGKDNWRKYPKSMLRARCVAFGLRALGEGDGSYTPDELGTVTAEDGTPGNDVAYIPPKEAAPAEGKASAPIVATTATGATHSTTHVMTSGQMATSKPARADMIPHDGNLATGEQVKMLHTLKSKLQMSDCDGTCAQEVQQYSKRAKGTVPKTVYCIYHTQLAAFKDEDGKPCRSSKDLSKTQISNLIDRYEARVRNQASRADQGMDLAAVVPLGPAKPTMGALLDLHFPVGQEDDLSAWVHATWGKDHVQDLDKEESACALQLLLAMSEGDEAYDKAETKARAMGLVR